ncbi:hypothetical protein Tdes44962_MAKER02122 [Teratosphaeria destructans]|uniref:Uncharacterized protein n=1 Tax=Teratosphaeria destructans TaxID=418781 RepID=A0A9W7SUT3_9PEZI|nr:hypothetical protein Tdes44962_MAKER02122 [Teratosphaeria destructans]
MHNTHLLLALCASSALAAPPQAKEVTNAAIYERSAVADAAADAQPLDTRAACPPWTYKRFRETKCSTKPHDTASGSKPSKCIKINLPPFHNPTGDIFDGAGVWELHAFTSSDCTTTPEYRSEVIGPDFGDVCGGDFTWASYYVKLKKGAKCAIEG